MNIFSKKIHRRNVEDEQKILEPYHHVAKRGTTQNIKMVTKALNYWFKLSDENLQTVNEILEMGFNSCYIMDDIQDESKMRGAEESTHTVHGVAASINTANYVYFLIFEKLFDAVSPDKMVKVTKSFVHKFIEIHKGQGMEIYWKDMGICPTEEEYLDMVRRKTGFGFVGALELMQIFEENNDDESRDYTNLGLILGTFLQIRDDYANLTSKEYEEYKGFCEDLTEGKFSFPVIHAIHKDPEDQTLIRILKQKTDKVHLKEYVLHRLKSLGSFDYTVAKMEEYMAQVLEEIEKLGGNPDLVELVTLANEDKSMNFH